MQAGAEKLQEMILQGLPDHCSICSEPMGNVVEHLTSFRHFCEVNSKPFRGPNPEDDMAAERSGFAQQFCVGNDICRFNHLTGTLSPVVVADNHAPEDVPEMSTEDVDVEPLAVFESTSSSLQVDVAATGLCESGDAEDVQFDSVQFSDTDITSPTGEHTTVQAESVDSPGGGADAQGEDVAAAAAVPSKPAGTSWRDLLGDDRTGRSSRGKSDSGGGPAAREKAQVQDAWAGDAHTWQANTWQDSHDWQDDGNAWKQDSWHSRSSWQAQGDAWNEQGQDAWHESLWHGLPDSSQEATGDPWHESGDPWASGDPWSQTKPKPKPMVYQ